jgi:transposase
MIKEGRIREWGGWLSEAKGSEIKELVSFANGLERDEKAVKNAIISDLSNGQTEGQVNRLKVLKRQMYGRAGFTLLKARVLGRTA